MTRIAHLVDFRQHRNVANRKTGARGLISVLLVVAPVSAQTSLSPTSTTELSYELVERRLSESVDGYWVAAPPGGALLPVLVYLSGGGSVGASLNRVRHVGPMAHLSDEELFGLHPFRDRFLVVTPHMRDGRSTERQWHAEAEAISTMLDEVIATHGGDPERIYLVGWSRGGAGVWGVASRLGNRLAAIAPLAGWLPDDISLDELRALPIWIVHGDQDLVVPLSEAERAVARLSRTSQDSFMDRPLGTSFPGDSIPSRVVTRLPAGTHEAAANALRAPDLYTWLLHFSRRPPPLSPIRSTEAESHG